MQTISPPGTEPARTVGCGTSMGPAGDCLVQFGSMPGPEPPTGFCRNGGRNYMQGSRLAEGVGLVPPSS